MISYMCGTANFPRLGLSHSANKRVSACRAMSHDLGVNSLMYLISSYLIDLVESSFIVDRIPTHSTKLTCSLLQQDPAF